MTNTSFASTPVSPRAARRFIGMRATAMHALFGILTLSAVQSVEAQERGKSRDKGDKAERGRGPQGIPPGHLPSAGECRVWYDNRPPGQQPKPTSCYNAQATVARSGGRVIYGDDVRRDNRGKDRDRDDDRRDNRRGDDDRRDDDRRDSDRRDSDRRDDRRADNDRRDDDRRRDRVCENTDRRQDECGYDDRTYPQTLPEMVWGVVFGRGERTNNIRQWVGAEPVRVSYTDSDRNGKPEAVTWTDNSGRIVQRWIDDNRDGRADRVSFYQNNKVVRVIKP